MHFINYFSKKTLKFDLINKFYYTNLKKLPQLKKIVLNFSCKTTEIKQLSTHLLALELITGQKGVLSASKHPNLALKIKKGNPSGCKLTLRKSYMINFLSKSFNEILPLIKNFTGINTYKRITKTTLSFVITDTLNFSELNTNYYLFKNLSKLNLSFTTKTSTEKELLFLIKSLQLPLKSE
jgi:large subunit ribosomal protein L5